MIGWAASDLGDTVELQDHPLEQSPTFAWVSCDPSRGFSMGG
jgi:hypothetical protein